MPAKKGMEERVERQQNAMTIGQDYSLTLQMFVYLQVLDLLTTLVGFKIGLGEVSPFIRWMMSVGPATGVIVSKIIALALAAICIQAKRFHVITWISYWYAALVVWNLSLILRV